MNWIQKSENEQALVNDQGVEVAWVSPVWNFLPDDTRIAGWRWYAVLPDNSDGHNTIKPQALEQALEQAERWVRKHT